MDEGGNQGLKAGGGGGDSQTLDSSVDLSKQLAGQDKTDVSLAM